MKLAISNAGYRHLYFNGAWYITRSVPPASSGTRAAVVVGIRQAGTSGSTGFACRQYLRGKS